MKLSELGEGMMLTVQHINDGEIEVMTIEEFLESHYYLDYSEFPTKVTLANETTIDFNFNNILDYLAESETHEGWIENVLRDIDKSDIDVKEFEEEINKIFRKNPTYWEGEVIDIDVLPSKVKTTTCKTCEHLCPFIDENLGNCFLDMKEVDMTKDFCSNYK